MIWIGLGTNQGNRVANMLQALSMMEKEQFRLKTLSSLYETAPWGITDQPSFLNAVVTVEKTFPPLEMLERLLKIEKNMGRIREKKWGPRLIDLDIIDYDQMILNESRLTLPHPYAHERDFVIGPMAELVPNYLLPHQEKTVSELLSPSENRSYSLLKNEPWDAFRTKLSIQP